MVITFPLTPDDAIRRAYAAVSETADQIVSDPALSEAFCSRVNGMLPSANRFDIVGLNKRLLNLRRKGEDQGGLGRKRRRYDGRNKKPTNPK